MLSLVLLDPQGKESRTKTFKSGKLVLIRDLIASVYEEQLK
jgi:hypothetical protein